MIWQGRRVVVPGLEVQTWLDTGLTWQVGQSRVAPRTRPPRVVVLHATDAEGNYKTVRRTLMARRLSVEFVLEHDGRVVQLLDPGQVHAAHCGGLNADSVGVEVVCRQGGTQNPRGRPRDEHIYQLAVEGRWVRSRRGSCWGLLPAQLEALRLLVPALCGQMGVPALLADERDWVPPEERPDAVLRGGVLGHAQVTLEHSDPPLGALAPFRRPAPGVPA